MIVLILRKKGSSSQKAYLLRSDLDIEIVREIVMRLGVFVHDLEFDLQGKLPD